MKKILLGLLVIFLILGGIMIVNTLRFSSTQSSDVPAEPERIDQTAAVSRLAAAVRLKTISHQDPAQMDPVPFEAFQTLIRESFPAIENNLKKTVINRYSLLYKWQGKNPDLKPMALLAHYDVVPVEPGTENDWTFAPFSGEVLDGFVWGRGTLDMKGTFMAILESVDALINQGFSPDRTLYLAFGHDEEVGGKNGAGKIAEYLRNEGISLSFTLDEGMVVLNEALSPSKKSLAIIGVAEKGYVTLKITAQGQGGHSSMPGFKTPISTLGLAAHRLETRQMKSTLSGPVGMLFDRIGPDLPFIQKLLFANQWAFKPLILMALEKSKTTNAMIRTTTALTMIQGGVKENVLPTRASLIANFRILPGDTANDVMAHAKKVIDDDACEIEIYKNMYTEPSPVSDIDSPAFAAIEKSVSQVFTGTAVSPGLVLGGTDSKHYTALSDNCYRFAPFVFGPEDPARIHGTNERIPVQDYIRAIQYYCQLIKNAAGQD